MSEKDEKEYLTLSFDDGEDVEYEVMGVITVEEKDYIVLIPENDADSVEIYGLIESEEDPESEEIFVIEDDDEYMKVVEALRENGIDIVVDEN